MFINKAKIYKNLRLLALGLLIFLLGIFFERLKINSEPKSIIEQLRLQDSGKNGYKFINPLLTCQTDTRHSIQEIVALKYKIQDYVDHAKSDGLANQISVYFDTRDGNWIGINTEERYSPASLLKVPNAIALYKASESNPNFLNTKLTFNNLNNANLAEHFAPTSTLEFGHAYTIENLIERMLRDSDNNTLPLLESTLNFAQFKEVYTDLGLTIPEGAGAGAVDFMTVKSYANFFRVLYNATYLEKSASEKVLSLLSDAGFKVGLKSPLPDDVAIAHKFGERSFPNDPTKTNQKELHDCGIVYVPNHHYLVCVMTKGSNFSNLQKIIADISALSYSYVTTEIDK